MYILDAGRRNSLMAKEYTYFQQVKSMMGYWKTLLKKDAELTTMKKQMHSTQDHGKMISNKEPVF